MRGLPPITTLCGRTVWWRSNRSGRPEIVGENVRRSGPNLPLPRLASKRQTRTWGTRLLRLLVEAPCFSRGKLDFSPAEEHRSEEHTSELQSLRHLVCR